MQAVALVGPSLVDGRADRDKDRDDTEIDAAPSDGTGPDGYGRSITVGFSLCSLPVRLRLSQLPISMVRLAFGSAV